MFQFIAEGCVGGWGEGGVGDWVGNGSLGGDEILIKLSTFSKLKSKSKNRPNNPFSTAVFLEKKVATFFYWKNFRFNFLRKLLKMSS